jgi:hypothetical protein
MANPTSDEFTQMITYLAEEGGLQRFRDKLVRFNALVTRRRIASVGKLADQLYMLTGGLRREVPATVALHSLWGEQVREKLGEDGEKELESVAEKVNSCLGERDRIVEGKEKEIEGFLREYEAVLAAAIGAERARLEMILKAVPDVAVMLRTMSLAQSSKKAAPTEKSAAADEVVETKKKVPAKKAATAKKGTSANKAAYAKKALAVDRSATEKLAATKKKGATRKRDSG